MRVLENGVYRDMTEEEIKEWEEMQNKNSSQPPTQEERIVELEKQNEFLTNCLLEMSMKVYE